MDVEGAIDDPGAGAEVDRGMGDVGGLGKAALARCAVGAQDGVGIEDRQQTTSAPMAIVAIDAPHPGPPPSGGGGQGAPAAIFKASLAADFPEPRLCPQRACRVSSTRICRIP
jgi:hypothetical protein